MQRTVSAAGRKKIEQREGIRTKAYKDTKGILTIGVGHTSAAGGLQVTAGMVLTMAQVDTLLSIDLKKFSKPVDEHVTVPLTQNQYDALVSFAFNIGENGFIGSTVLRKLNKKDYQGAADAMLMWEKPPELKGRREDEHRQFLTPDPIITLPTPPVVVQVPLPPEPVVVAPVTVPTAAIVLPTTPTTPVTPAAPAPVATDVPGPSPSYLRALGQKLFPNWIA